MDKAVERLARVIYEEQNPFGVGWDSLLDTRRYLWYDQARQLLALIETAGYTLSEYEVREEQHDRGDAPDTS